MTGHTEQTNAQATGQGSHHYVLSLDIPGRTAGCWFGTFTPSPTATRYDVLRHLMDHVRTENPEFDRANVVFFSLEPNRL